MPGFSPRRRREIRLEPPREAESNVPRVGGRGSLASQCVCASVCLSARLFEMVRVSDSQGSRFLTARKGVAASPGGVGASPSASPGSKPYPTHPTIMPTMPHPMQQAFAELRRRTAGNGRQRRQKKKRSRIRGGSADDASQRVSVYCIGTSAPGSSGIGLVGGHSEETRALARRSENESRVRRRVWGPLRGVGGLRAAVGAARGGLRPAARPSPRCQLGSPLAFFTTSCTKSWGTKTALDEQIPRLFRSLPCRPSGPWCDVLQDNVVHSSLLLMETEEQHAARYPKQVRAVDALRAKGFTRLPQKRLLPMHSKRKRHTE